ncbi:MAG: prolipoprotein diacylglyceryl transferase [Bryobacteraceae bacterium]
MFPKLFSIGSFYLPTYGLLVALGFLAALFLAVRLARRAGLDPEKVSNLAVYAALVGLLGAKLLMLVFDFGYYARHPDRIFSLETLLSAGVYYGGFLLALAFSAWYVRHEHLPFLATADVLAPAVALGHAIGRLGCFAAGCCWGTPCHLPWAVVFRNPEAYTGVPLGVPLHPAQLYESALTFVVAGLLIRASYRPHPAGRILGLYLVFYSIARFGVEFFRYHEQALPFGGPFSLTQWIALALLAAGSLLLWKVRRPARP